MNEQQRQQYLTAMGIHTWYSRRILPAAKPFNIVTGNWKPPAEPRENGSLKTISQTLSATPHAFRQMLNILDTRGTEKTLADLENSPVITTDSDKRNEKAPAQMATPFRIMVISPAHDVLVVSDTPLANDESLFTRQKRLVFSILFALGVECHPVTEWVTDNFAWPLPGLQSDLPEEEAGLAVTGFLTNRFGLTRKKFVLLLGPFSAKHVLGVYRSHEQMYGIHKQAKGAIWGVSHSIDQILKLPVLKPDVWKHLHALTESGTGTHE